MMRQHALLFEWLEVAEAMRAFITHRLSGSEEVCDKLEQVESDLATTQKAAANETEALKLAEGEKKEICVEMDRLRKEGRAIEAKCKEVKQENAQLKKKLEELRVEFAAQRKELEEYQKQVDEMYFYDYRCCTKNEIT